MSFGGTFSLTNANDADGRIFDPSRLTNPDDPLTRVNGLVTVILGTVPPGVLRVDPVPGRSPLKLRAAAFESL